MTKQIAIELLKQGNTGNDIIAILDTLTEEDNKGEMVDFEGNPTSIWYTHLTYVNCLWYTKEEASDPTGCVCCGNMCKT